jgi:hypothetical protein
VVLKIILVFSKRETGGLSLKRKRKKEKEIYTSAHFNFRHLQFCVLVAWRNEDPLPRSKNRNVLFFVVCFKFS